MAKLIIAWFTGGDGTKQKEEKKLHKQVKKTSTFNNSPSKDMYIVINPMDNQRRLGPIVL